MEESKAIELVQLPVIKHRLIEIGASVAKRLKDLNIESQIATVDTVKSLKDLRAELNKELKDYEEQRMFVKKGVNKPYDDFEEVYKSEISEKYKTAIDKLKDKIVFVEDNIKTQKKQNIEAYFYELCLLEKIDFVKFEQLNLEINLSTTEKTYRESIDNYITRVISDLALINTLDFAAETLAEYKCTLNASQSITTIKERKEAEKREEERIKQNVKNGRIADILSIGMHYDDFTKTYQSDDDTVFISIEFIESASNDDFRKKFVEIESRLNELKKAKEQKQEPVQLTMEMQQPVEVKAPVIEAPKVEVKEEIVKASFEVLGTMVQLKALGQYMKQNNITYKNI